LGGQADIRQLLNPEVLRRVAEHSARFASASPFPHVVIDNFLERSFCDEICRQFPAFSASAALNEDGRVGGKAVQEKVRALGPAFRQLDDLVQSADFSAYITEITGIARLRYDPWYFGGGTHENRAGQDLDPHIDFNYHPITRQHRRLNLIVYLNQEWQDQWGGSLQLHRDPGLPAGQDEIVTVTPLMNRCVIFETSERSWHGFQSIRLPPGKAGLSRRSFAIYLYTDTRPPDEVAEEHSTVYVERHLPDHFVPGHTLSDADVSDLRNLLGRRDQHLQRLYRQIQELNGRLNRSWLDAAEMRLRRGVHRFENATSLRISVPLRALRRAFQRAAPGRTDRSRRNDRR
jgi:hypothetical protein